jgi:nitronate monooxygenase
MQQLFDRLRLPAIAAPMFLISGPDLVVEVCRSGLIGTFPALNCRGTGELDAWLTEIESRLAQWKDSAPFGINLIVNSANRRLESDLEAAVRHRVPLVITSLGAVRDVVDAVHAYGGLVFHDVINRRHAEKAAEAGVDGIIAISAGAGGHTGTMSPFALVAEIREVFGGVIVLGGAISSGQHIAAVRMMGADLAYLGTRFMATRESLASKALKDMLLASRAADIVHTPSLTGVHANFLRLSLEANGLDPGNLPPHTELRLREKVQPWKSVWSAGHGVGSISDVPPAALLCEKLKTEYRQALADFTSSMMNQV